MKSEYTDITTLSEEPCSCDKNDETPIKISPNITESLDSLVEYLVDNNIDGIHPLIMGEIERRLIIKVLERSRGNKLRAARRLGMSRNTFHRKMLKLQESIDLENLDS
jgi:DNA-binding protein Fis